MSPKEQEFIKDLKELFVKYDASIGLAAQYYPDDPVEIKISLSGEPTWIDVDQELKDRYKIFRHY